MTQTIPTPELDKMSAVKERSQAIGEFLDWLAYEKEWTLAAYHEHTDDCYNQTQRYPTCGIREKELWQVQYSTERLLAEYFEIDLRKTDEEKRAILESIR